MSALPAILVAASAVIILSLGLLHLFLTFCGTKLHPRDAEVLTKLQQVSLVLTRETTMWRAWIGFNASHSYGAILFGAVYGYLALAHAELLFESWFLLLLGLLFLVGYTVLAKLYWFRVPFRGILLATVFYVIALVVAVARA